MSSRLGDPAPQPKTGAARFASATAQKTTELVTLERQNGETLKRQKQPMTIRLTASAIDKLSEIERSMRRVGIRARQASASEIVEALIEGADPVSLAEVFKSGKR